MDRLASSIVILGACIVFSAAGFIKHSDTNVFVNFVALVVAAFGAYGWFTAERDLRQDR